MSQVGWVFLNWWAVSLDAEWVFLSGKFHMLFSFLWMRSRTSVQCVSSHNVKHLTWILYFVSISLIFLFRILFTLQSWESYFVSFLFYSLWQNMEFIILSHYSWYLTRIIWIIKVHIHILRKKSWSIPFKHNFSSTTGFFPVEFHVQTKKLIFPKLMIQLFIVFITVSLKLWQCRS